MSSLKVQQNCVILSIDLTIFFRERMRASNGIELRRSRTDDSRFFPSTQLRNVYFSSLLPPARTYTKMREMCAKVDLAYFWLSPAAEKIDRDVFVEPIGDDRCA